MQKLYQKPEVSKIKLVAEEAVLTNCKTSRNITAGGCWKYDDETGGAVETREHGP